ncbi:MAG: 4Fe-4S binding protein [Eubacteriales bacterium]
MENNNKKLIVIEERCPQNHPCPSMRVCPTRALKQDGFSAPTVNYEKCIACGKCVRFCPKSALVLK